MRQGAGNRLSVRNQLPSSQSPILSLASLTLWPSQRRQMLNFQLFTPCTKATAGSPVAMHAAVRSPNAAERRGPEVGAGLAEVARTLPVSV